MTKDPTRAHGTDSETRLSGSRLGRALWVSAGTASLAIGLVGIAVPVLPTTPFLLIAAACYLRGSVRMYNWMVSNRHVGRYIADYVEGRGISVRAKAASITALWVLIALSAILATDSNVTRAILFVVAVAVTAHILMLKTKPRE